MQYFRGRKKAAMKTCCNDTMLVLTFEALCGLGLFYTGPWPMEVGGAAAAAGNSLLSSGTNSAAFP